MKPGDKVPCVFCLAPQDSLEVRVDKHGRPYLQCRRCLTRCFIHNDGWAGPQRFFGKLRMAADQPDPVGVAAELIKRERERSASNA